MIYIVYYEWKNTAGNHAGMAYLFRYIKEQNPKTVKLIRVPHYIAKKANKYIQRIYVFLISLYIFVFSTPRTKVLFTEYLGNVSGNQTKMAFWFNILLWRGGIYGMVHLSESHLKELYGSDEYIRKQLSLVNEIIVLGSTLSDYFKRLGYGEKIWLTYHYVDTSYYFPLDKSNKETGMLNVIAMGSLKRNHHLLYDIAKRTPDIHYTICMGQADLSLIFKDLENVILCGFMSESELLHRMQMADVSMSVMDDTVGSNVITTSMACGLPQIVSDVGSIRDYCNDDNAIFCKNVDDFVVALNRLSCDRILLRSMSIAARNKAMDIDIKSFNKLFVGRFL